MSSLKKAEWNTFNCENGPITGTSITFMEKEGHYMTLCGINVYGVQLIHPEAFRLQKEIDVYEEKIGEQAGKLEELKLYKNEAEKQMESFEAVVEMNKELIDEKDAKIAVIPSLLDHRDPTMEKYTLRKPCGLQCLRGLCLVG